MQLQYSDRLVKGIGVRHNSDHYLSGLAPDSQFKNVTADYGFYYSKVHLNYQAQLFASSILERSKDLDLKRVLGTNRSTYRTQLSNCYKYSYISAILYGLNWNKVSDYPERRYVFPGHGVFQRLLQKRLFRDEYNDGNYTVIINRELSITKDDLDAIIDQFFVDNPTLRGTYFNGDLQFSYRNDELDNVMSALYYQLNKPSRSRSTRNSGNVNNNKQNGKSVVSDTSDSTYVDDDAVTLDTSDPITGKLFEMCDPQLDNMISQGSNPLGNTVLSKTGDKFYYINTSSESADKIKDNISMFFNRANCIYIKEMIKFGDNNYYSSVDRNRRVDFFIKEDVYAIAWLKSNYMVDFLEEKDFKKEDYATTGK